MDVAIFRLAVCGRYRRDSLDNCPPSDINQVSSLRSSALHYAVLGGNKDTVRYFVAKGSDVNAFNVYHESVLHWACKEGNTNIIRFLLQHKACPNALDSEGNTPMHWAAEYNHGKVIRLLAKYGGLSSLSIRNEEFRTPLQVAEMNNSRKASRALKKNLFRLPSIEERGLSE